MPTANAKLSDLKPKSSIEEDDTSKAQEKPPQFIDLQIVHKMCYLCSMTNQILTHTHDINEDLEQALLTFVLSFKNHILTDSRLILLGSHLAEDANGSEDVAEPVDTIEGVYNESKQAY